MRVNPPFIGGNVQLPRRRWTFCLARSPPWLCLVGSTRSLSTSSGPNETMLTRTDFQAFTVRKDPGEVPKMRRFVVVIVVFATMTLFAQQAWAVNPHLKGNNPILFTDNGLTLTATVSYAGLGNFDSLQVLTATGNPTATCTNPSGKNQPPGQNPAPVTTTARPTTPIPGAPDCPNPLWTETITGVAFTSAMIQLFQDQTAGTGTFGRWETIVLTVNCTFSPPTSNGPVPSSSFTCSVV